MASASTCGICGKTHTLHTLEEERKRLEKRLIASLVKRRIFIVWKKGLATTDYAPPIQLIN